MSSDYYDGPPEPRTDHSVTLNAEVCVEWSQGEVMKSVIDQVSRMIYMDIKPAASLALASALDDLANKALEETFDSEIQQTDKWGKPIGAAINVRALLQRDAETWLMDNVDSNGRTGRDHYGTRHPRIHWLFEKALGKNNDRRDNKTSLQKMVISAIKAVIGDVDAVINATVREKVKEALKIK